MTIPHYKIVEIGGKNLVVFYPQFKDDEGYKIIDLENRFPIELKNEEEYKMFLEAIITSEDLIKDGLKTLADLVDEMSLLAKGPKGDTRFMWVKYADDDKGSGMSDNPDGKKYIGMAFNKDKETPSDDPSDYKWVKYVADYEGLEIGGRNLLLGTTYEELTGEFSTWNSDVYYVSDNVLDEVKHGGTYTMSVYFTHTESNNNSRFGLIFQFYYSNGAHHSQYQSYNTFLESGETGWSIYTFNLPDVSDIDEIIGARVYIRSDNNATGSSAGKLVRYKWLKLEKGNKATDWSPAPEDIYELIDNVDKTHVGLSNVQNYGIASQSQAENGTSNNAYMTPLRTKQAIEKLSPNYVIDTEIGDDYILKKYSDGTFELKGHTVITTEIETELSGIYRSSNLSLQDVLNDLLPANAKMVYSNAWLMDGYFNTWMATSGVSNPVTDNTIRFRLFSYSSRSSSDYIIGYEIAGTWS